MSTSNAWLEDTLVAGGVATLATTVAAAVSGRCETDSALAPINAVSHIAWGDEAARHEGLSFRYTGIGAALNAAAVTMWAGVHAWLAGRAARRGDVPAALASGAAVAAAAYVVDYHVVSRRFTPGFELRLSNRSLLGIYTTLALSLAAGSLLRR